MQRQATRREVIRYYNNRHCHCHILDDGTVLFRRHTANQWSRGFRMEDYRIENQRLIMKEWN